MKNPIQGGAKWCMNHIRAPPYQWSGAVLGEITGQIPAPLRPVAVGPPQRNGMTVGSGLGVAHRLIP